MGYDENGFYRLTPKSYTTTKQLDSLRKVNRGKILFRHGHIAICDYEMGSNREFEKTLSVWDEIRFKYELVGGYYVKSLKEFRINRGYDIQMLYRFFPHHKFVVDNDAYPYKESGIKLVTPPKDDFQRVALTFMTCQGNYVSNTNFTQQMIEAQTGSGKAQPDTTEIPTTKGIKLLKDLKVGDYVFSEYGKPIRITGIFPQGIQDSYRITFRSTTDPKKIDFSTSCNLDHLWTLTDIETNRPVTMSLREILRLGKENFTLTYPCSGSYSPTEIIDNELKYSINITKYDVARIVSINKEDEPCSQRCILVDNPTHLYLTEYFIPTHNTYLSIATSCFLSSRSVIIVPFDKLISQWKESILKFTDATENDILVVKGSKICEKIRKGEYKNIKYFIVMSDTLYSYQKRYGDMKMIEMLRMTRAYAKFVDEIHRDIKAVAMIEALSNFRMNYYMSASPGRAQRKENWIFRTLFSTTPRFGADFQHKSEQYLNVVIKRYQFVPTQEQIRKMINSRKKWLNAKAYETELINASPQQRKSFEDSVRVMLSWAKKQKKDGNKILILMSTIDGTEYIQKIAEEIFHGETSRYYGSMPSKSEKEEALKKTVICATDSSLGTGSDIPNLQFVFCAVTYTAWTQIIQMSGRLRRLPDAECVYCELVNNAWYKTQKQYEKRIPYLVKRSRTGKLLVIN